MRKTFLVILISFLIFSCNSKIENTLEDIIDNISFNKTKSNSTEIIIKLYDTTTTKRRITDVESFIPKKEFKATSKQQLENFDKVFINAEKPGIVVVPLLFILFIF
jgi:hypothetical protein